MSPAGSGSPSKVVTMPTMSTTRPLSVACGSMRITSSCSGVQAERLGVSSARWPCRRSCLGDTGTP